MWDSIKHLGRVVSAPKHSCRARHQQHARLVGQGSVSDRSAIDRSNTDMYWGLFGQAAFAIGFSIVRALQLRGTAMLRFHKASAARRQGPLQSARASLPKPPFTYGRIVKMSQLERARNGSGRPTPRFDTFALQSNPWMIVSSGH